MHQEKDQGNRGAVPNGTELNEHGNVNDWAQQAYNASGNGGAAMTAATSIPASYSMGGYYGGPNPYPYYCMGDGSGNVAWPTNGVYGAPTAPPAFPAAYAAALSYNYYPTWNAYGPATNAGPSVSCDPYCRMACDCSTLEGAMRDLNFGQTDGLGQMSQTLEPNYAYTAVCKPAEVAPATSNADQRRATTWASIAKQPAKPITHTVGAGIKKKGPGMPPPPVLLGRHDLNEWDAKDPPSPPKLASPPKSSTPSYWYTPPLTDLPAPAPAPLAPVPIPSSVPAPAPVPVTIPISAPAPASVPVTALPPEPAVVPKIPVYVPISQPSKPVTVQKAESVPKPIPKPTTRPISKPKPPSPPPVMTRSSSPPPSVLEKLMDKNNYNPDELQLPPKGTRFFVIKSYAEDDVHRSIKYEIWCSTEHGNKRLDEAFTQQQKTGGAVYLFFSVNASGFFCGVARMTSAVDYGASSGVWAQDKWRGQFGVRWLYVKDVPNASLRHIKLENNENKPVTNSRDTQEVPYDKGVQVLKIIHGFNHTTSIFDDFTHYEKRQEEGDKKPMPPPLMSGPSHDWGQYRNNRGNSYGNKERDGGDGYFGQSNFHNRARGNRNYNSSHSNYKNQSNPLRS